MRTATQSATVVSTMAAAVVEVRRGLDAAQTVLLPIDSTVWRALPLHLVVRFWCRIRHGSFFSLGITLLNL